jgi:hypothetical protein
MCECEVESGAWRENLPRRRLLPSPFVTADSYSRFAGTTRDPPIPASFVLSVRL